MVTGSARLQVLWHSAPGARRPQLPNQQITLLPADADRSGRCGTGTSACSGPAPASPSSAVGSRSSRWACWSITGRDRRRARMDRSGGRAAYNLADAHRRCPRRPDKQAAGYSHNPNTVRTQRPIACGSDVDESHFDSHSDRNLVHQRHRFRSRRTDAPGHDIRSG